MKILIASGAGGYAGQVAANNIDPSNHSSAIKAAAFAAGGGGIAKLLPTKNLNTISQAGYFGPKSLGGLFNSQNSAWLWGASSVSAGVGAAANFK